MAVVTGDLGKVGLSVNGVHDSTIAYEKLSIVSANGISYVSKKDVPAGTALNNTEYWMPMTDDEAAAGAAAEAAEDARDAAEEARSLIDDDAGEGDTDKVWSADKDDAEISRIDEYNKYANKAKKMVIKPELLTTLELPTGHNPQSMEIVGDYLYVCHLNANAGTTWISKYKMSDFSLVARADTELENHSNGCFYDSNVNRLLLSGAFDYLISVTLSSNLNEVFTSATKLTSGVKCRAAAPRENGFISIQDGGEACLYEYKFNRFVPFRRLYLEPYGEPVGDGTFYKHLTFVTFTMEDPYGSRIVILNNMGSKRGEINLIFDGELQGIANKNNIFYVLDAEGNLYSLGNLSAIGTSQNYHSANTTNVRDNYVFAEDLTYPQNNNICSSFNFYTVNNNWYETYFQIGSLEPVKVVVKTEGTQKALINYSISRSNKLYQIQIIYSGTNCTFTFASFIVVDLSDNSITKGTSIDAFYTYFLNTIGVSGKLGPITSESNGNDRTTVIS